MSEQVKHTPGPWRFSLSIPDRSFESQVWDAEGRALLFFADGRSVGTEADANARLIAAAPDLLAALQEAEAMLLVAMRRDLEFDRDTQTTIIDGHSGMVKIRAAIAKAKGGAP